MKRTLKVVTQSGAGFAEPAPTRSVAPIAVGVVVLAALGAATFAAHRELGAFLSALDDETLGQATRTLDRLLERQRDQLAAETTVLADDNRIRATVLAPTFDEATVQDVLEDLRKSSGATLLAVLDGNGRVQTVTGTGALREADLGASPSVKAAFSRATSDLWTLPDQVQVIGLAPIRSGDQTPALLVKGLPLGKSQLATVEATLGVMGAVFVGDKITAASTQGAELDEVFRAASQLSDGTARIETARGSYLARVAHTGRAATSARVAWLVPFHHHAERARVLTVLVFFPAALGALLFLLLFSHARRTNGGNP